MLEVKNLKKVYKVKNSDSVYALNNVSLKFPEKGFVFILGKSGSGKSTLLNVMGGLDKADEGEIIINGKSSKEFNGSEMDSYRNTYLGFIFQEYNILSDFTVKENIALALQLQHKKATEEAINNILEQVDLAGYGQRKPNELSGGQKQRVAIARALVKEPKIIFGDEPTGALDSNTGRQVFETLKKLSQEKLVVVVSHDRDFAEHFGDRVIELKDGIVISDITKTSVESKKANDGVSLIGDNIIRIDPNHLLDQNDLNLINDAISKSGKETFISLDPSVNEAVCEAARIDKSGNREEFVSTDSSKINTGNDKFSVIKSKFSLGHAFRMGAKSMRVKPVRLAFTIILATASFSLFGASSTLAFFSTKDALSSSITKNEIKNALISAGTKTDNGTISGFKQEYIDDIKDKTGLNVYKIEAGTPITLNVPTGIATAYDLTRLTGFMNVNQTVLDDLSLNLVSGSLPKNNNEICISLFTYYSYEDLGIGSNVNDSTYIKPSDITKEKVIGSSISGEDYSNGSYQKIDYKIVGIIDTNFPTKYDSFKGKKESEVYNDTDYRNFYTLKNETNIHTVMFKNESDMTQDESISLNNGIYINNENSMNVSVNYYTDGQMIFFDKNKTSLADDEILLGRDICYSVDDYFGISSDKDNSSVDHTYEGAYTDYSGTNKCSVTNLDSYQAMNCSKQAATYKVCYDNYKEFYNEHLDIIKKINRGEYEGIYYSGSYVSDDEDSYNNMSDEMKYQMFLTYIKYFVSGFEADNSPYLSTNSYYYDKYQEAYKSYLKETFSVVGMNSYSKILNVISNYQENILNSYINGKVDFFYEKYKNDSRLINIIRKFGLEDEDSLSESNKQQVISDFWYMYKTSLEEYAEASEQSKTKIQELLSLIDVTSLPTDLSVKLGYNGNKTKTLKIVGYDLNTIKNSRGVFMNKASATKLKTELENLGVSTETGNNYYIVGFGNDKAKQEKFIQYYMEKRKPFDDTGTTSIESGLWYMTFSDDVLSNVQMISTMIVVLTKAFLYVGIVLAVFSALLFYNFISVSINNKKREIGILRAVGAKRSDVFKIFYSEAFIIGIINFILSTIITFVVSYLVNKNVSKTLNFNVMNPNAYIVLILLGVSALVSIVSALLPVIKIANKKPIDAIQNR